MEAKSSRSLMATKNNQELERNLGKIKENTKGEKTKGKPLPRGCIKCQQDVVKSTKKISHEKYLKSQISSLLADPARAAWDPARAAPFDF